MKTITTKQAFASVGLMLLSLTSFSKEHVTMSLKNIQTTANTIEYDLFIVNDGTTALKLSACSYGVNFNSAILNGGTVTYSYKQNTRGTALNGLTSFSLNTNKVAEVNQLRMTSTPSNFSNAPDLVPNIPFKVGRFKVTNSNSWAANSKADFSMLESKVGGLTTTLVVGYIDNINKLTALTPGLNTVTTIVEDGQVLNPTQSSASSTDITQGSSQVEIGNSLMSNNNNVNVYPNPVLDILNTDFVLAKASALTIYITDMNGRLVKQIQTNAVEGLNKINIDLGSFSQGIYTLKMTDSKDFNYTQTFTKQ